MNYYIEIKRCDSREKLEFIVETFSKDRYAELNWRFWRMFYEKYSMYIKEVDMGYIGHTY